MKEEFKKFIVDNGVIGTTAGVCIAFITKDLIQSLVSDLVIPTIILILSFLKLKVLIDILPKKNGINIVNFLNQLITWIFLLIISFLFISYSIKYLGISKSPETNTKKV
jgi:large-conductance mechanosensitive channel